MPEVTKLCVYVQEAYNQLQHLQEQPDQEEAAELKEFVVLQLLQLAQVLDYSDEVGRRRMLALSRTKRHVPRAVSAQGAPLC